MDQQAPEQVPAASQPVQFERIEDFVSLYANNVRFQLSAWDLKIIFGELEQTGDLATVEQHTAITISWIQAKVMSYFLQANVAIYEAVNGKIGIPAEVVPPRPEPPDQKNPVAVKAADALSKVYERFIANL